VVGAPVRKGGEENHLEIEILLGYPNISLYSGKVGLANVNWACYANNTIPTPNRAV